jgi:hypothetical protein
MIYNAGDQEGATSGVAILSDMKVKKHFKVPR